MSKHKNIFLYFLLFAVVFVSCNQEQGMFTKLPSSKTHIEFSNTLAKKKFFNILYYLYYYNGGGVAIGDINNDGLADIYFTANNKGGNKLYLNKGNFEFEDITVKAGVAGTADWSTGVTMADVNADGFLDIYVSTVSNRYGLVGHNELFINKGNNTFSEESEKYGLNTSCLSTQSVFFDYDRDGDLDCFILNQSHHPHANIVDTAKRNVYDTLSGDRLYRNDIAQTGKFVDVSEGSGIYRSNLGYGLGLAVSDINNDGWEDIYIGNDFHENDYYYINNRKGGFIESGAKHFKHYSRFSMGNDVADYNNDGQLDVVTVDMLPPDEKVLKTYGSDENPDIYKVKLELNGYQKQYSKNSLQRNNGNGESFSETSLYSGVAATDWSWAPLFADFDNDGLKDLFISSGIVKRPVDLDYVRFVSDLDMKKGRQESDEYDDVAIENMPDGSSHPYFFKNEGGFNFKDVSKNWGTQNMKGFFNGASYADLDNDGNLDVVINCINAPAVILKNNSVAKKTLSLSFKGVGANVFGIGTKAWVFAGGKMQYQQLELTRGFQSSTEPILHFGMDSLAKADSILIVWPNQQFQVIRNIQVAGKLQLKQVEAKDTFQYNLFFPPAKKLMEDITSEMGSEWRHLENDFLDYNRQYLIPHMLSTEGPKIAVADVNKDGLEDFYVCGASMQAGALMLQTANGKFMHKTLTEKSRMKATEETNAVFFDANNDGWPDLYITSGGNQYDNGNPALLDNLYLNDGKGNLVQVLNAIPDLRTNKSCVSAADIDKDGDIDLFVGGLADAIQYGVPQPSFLLLNGGNGNFTKATTAQIALDSLGMVTSSSFTDINKDGWPDLVVTGEWMPLKIFINNKGQFKEMDIPHSNGLWQTITTADMNGDGFVDILAGNWGENNKLWSGKNGPVKLYVKDFDNNGSVEQVMAYTINGEEFTFLCKDELERSLPILKKAYLTYGEVAGKTVQYMFYDLFKDYRALSAETLSSSCFINDGKGNFTRKSLPADLQLAPVFTFTSMQSTTVPTFLGAGNFYGVIPYEGRYDALAPTAFTWNQTGNIFNTVGALPLPDGEIRDAKWINMSGGKRVLVLSVNNQGLLFYQ